MNQNQSFFNQSNQQIPIETLLSKFQESNNFIFQIFSHFIFQQSQMEKEMKQFSEKLSTVEQKVENVTIKLTGETPNENRNENKEFVVQEEIDLKMKTYKEMNEKENEIEMKEKELRKRKEEVEKFRNEMKQMKSEIIKIKRHSEQVSLISDEMISKESIFETNVQFQIDTIMNDVEKNTKEIEKQIDEKVELSDTKRKIMKEELYCELFEKAKKQIEELKVNEEKKKEGVIEKLFKMNMQQNEMKKKMETICENVPHHVVTPFTLKQVDTLEEFIGLKCSEIIFDSEKDNWANQSSVFNQRIVGRSKITFLIEEENGDIFGYYLNTKVIEDYMNRIETDDQSFEFHFHSNSNRIQQPIKYKIKDAKKGGCCLFEQKNDFLIWLGDIRIFKENRKCESVVKQNDDKFYYHKIKNALIGEKDNFNPKRIVAIQMM